jgi:hypothetical protein
MSRIATQRQKTMAFLRKTAVSGTLPGTAEEETANLLRQACAMKWRSENYSTWYSRTLATAAMR